jgi:hypothetical protein
MLQSHSHWRREHYRHPDGRLDHNQVVRFLHTALWLLRRSNWAIHSICSRYVKRGCQTRAALWFDLMQLPHTRKLCSVRCPRVEHCRGKGIFLASVSMSSAAKSFTLRQYFSVPQNYSQCSIWELWSPFLQQHGISSWYHMPVSRYHQLHPFAF